MIKVNIKFKEYLFSIYKTMFQTEFV